MACVLVGLDGSETSRSAFREAIREAGWRGASVRAVHVVAHPVAAGDGFGSRIDLDRLREAGARFLSAELDRLEREHDGGFPVRVVGHITLGHYGMEIIAASRGVGHDDGPAELVVLGSRGLGGFQGLLLGSVTTYAVHHLTCRLLIIPAVDAA